MSWTNIKSTGRGGLEFRLVIEGWPYQFVSQRDMEQTIADGRIRMAGLDRAGIVLEEQAKPHLAETEGRAITFRIVDRQNDDAATKAFFTLPTTTTWLSADITTASSSITTVGTLVGFTVYHIGTEAIKTDIIIGGG